MQDLIIYNTLHRQKELFRPINAPHVGMYVCGPTVYGDPHLGHARPAITFDVLFRYLKHIGYKVRYVRNITDVGHLEHDADEGDDKIEKKARLEQLEPMEVAQYYTNRYHDAMRALNVLPPSIEPHATGHIIEQEQLVKEILDNGYAYVSKGSVYFDIQKYDKKYHPRQPLRHPRRRNGPYLPSPRVRDSSGCSLTGRPDGEVLDAQQHDNH